MLSKQMLEVSSLCCKMVCWDLYVTCMWPLHDLCLTLVWFLYLFDNIVFQRNGFGVLEIAIIFLYSSSSSGSSSSSSSSSSSGGSSGGGGGFFLVMNL